MKEPRCTVCGQPYTVRPRHDQPRALLHHELGAQVRAAPDLARECAEWREAHAATRPADDIRCEITVDRWCATHSTGQGPVYCAHRA